MKASTIFLVVMLLSITTIGAAQDTTEQSQEAQQAKLAKQSQNPVANMISIPFEFWHHDGSDGQGFAGLVKPVIPTPLGKINLINRFILPYLSVDGAMDSPDFEFDGVVVDQKGLSDITYQGFLSPANPGALIWGAGAALQMPTATTDALGTQRWSVGPSLLLLSMPGNWVVGLLAQNIWDFAGSGDTDVNKLTLQPILSYQLGGGWYLTSTPVMTANWTADSGERWNIPLGAGVGKLQRIGKLPVDFKLVYYNYVEKPTLGADWSVLLGVKFLLPK